ncbi:hypothetical protein [Shinella sp.]|uniref:hypothetical protein n=1 Tax=Shinella sp. TaxID=1870904 RepID=UPI00301D9AED
MADRKLPTSLSVGPVTGPDYMDAVAAKMDMLFDSIALKPTSVVSSGNDYTITVDPVLDADVTAGMSFFIQPNDTNTGPSRLRVGGANPYYDLVKAGGEALNAGEFSASTAYFVVFLGGEFRILSVANNEGGGGANINFQRFDVSGNWTKPDGLSPEAILIIDLWSGGGGGGTAGNANSGGGGGGGHYQLILRAADVTSVVPVTVGAGGAIDAAGGSSAFGSYFTVVGGDAGGAGSNGNNAPGSAGGRGGNAGSVRNGSFGSGAAGSAGNGGGGAGGNGGTADLHGGGGGGGGGGKIGSAAPNTGGSGGNAYFGGGGGGANGNVGGTSVYGGAGGGTGVAGSAPSGGGGRGAPGASGRAIVRVIG